MFPVFLALFPLFKTLQNVSLLNTYTGLVIVYIAYSLPFTVFFLTAFFRTLPTGVAEAAVVDGAGHYRLFFQVMLPMAKPGLVAITIFNVIGQWNQFLLPLVMLSHQEHWTLPLGVTNFSTQYSTDTALVLAYTTLALIPALVFYVIAERQLVGGLTSGSVKG